MKKIRIKEGSHICTTQKNRKAIVKTTAPLVFKIKLFLTQLTQKRRAAIGEAVAAF